MGAPETSRGTLVKMTWLILGAHGQLGRSLSLVLGERRIRFVACGSKELDITSTRQCLELIDRVSPSVIINAAAWTDVDGAESDPGAAYAVNAIGPKNLVTGAKKVGAVFAHVSTDYVFSGLSKTPWQEYDLRDPSSVYGSTKAAGEVEVLTHYPERSYIFRTAWLYSQWGKNFAKTMTKLALFGETEVKVVNDQVGQPTSSIDLANQIFESIYGKLPVGIYHGTNSGQASWFEFAQKIFELSGASSSRVVPVSSSEFVRPAKRPEYSVLGHEAWISSASKGYSIREMRDWKSALTAHMPEIVKAVQNENRI